MALFEHKSADEAAPFRERRTKGRLVTFTPDIVAEHVPSPARALQQALAERTGDMFIVDPAERRVALVRFIGAATLLWGGMATTIVTMMVFVR